MKDFVEDQIKKCLYGRSCNSDSYSNWLVLLSRPNWRDGENIKIAVSQLERFLAKKDNRSGVWLIRPFNDIDKTVDSVYLIRWIVEAKCWLLEGKVSKGSL